jgi:hypothetical protein
MAGPRESSQNSPTEDSPRHDHRSLSITNIADAKAFLAALRDGRETLHGVGSIYELLSGRFPSHGSLPSEPSALALVAVLIANHGTDARFPADYVDHLASYKKSKIASTYRDHPRFVRISYCIEKRRRNAGGERPADWQKNLDRLTRKHDTARTLVPKPILDEVEGAKIGIIAYGSTDPAIQEARDRLQSRGVATSYLRVRALPLEVMTRAFVEKYDRVYVAELNQDGQMHQLVRLHVPERAAQVRSVRICDGLPMSARFVTESILEQEGT